MHSCPECGQACYCGENPDDLACCHDVDLALGCEHCPAADHDPDDLPTLTDADDDCAWAEDLLA